RDGLARSLRAEGVLDTLLETVTEGDALQARPIDPRFTALKLRFVDLHHISPHKRGFAFERFLVELFHYFLLEPKAPFRLSGEQIDGSFVCGEETYLVEAKWHDSPIGQAPLLILKEKVQSKSAWSRGMFISYSGFSQEGLQAFSRGRATNII